MSERAIAPANVSDTVDHIQALYLIDNAAESLGSLSDEQVVTLFRAANMATVHALLSHNPADNRFIVDYADRSDRLGDELHRRVELSHRHSRKQRK